MASNSPMNSDTSDLRGQIAEALKSVTVKPHQQLNEAMADAVMPAITRLNLESRIDELEHLAVDGTDELVRCYFTQDNPDCSKDEPIVERIDTLKQERAKL